MIERKGKNLTNIVEWAGDPPWGVGRTQAKRLKGRRKGKKRGGVKL